MSGKYLFEETIVGQELVTYTSEPSHPPVSPWVLSQVPQSWNAAFELH